MYGIDYDDEPGRPATATPAYTLATLRRMSVEDQIDAAMTNLERTGRPRWGRRADRAVRHMVMAR